MTSDFQITWCKFIFHFGHWSKLNATCCSHKARCLHPCASVKQAIPLVLQKNLGRLRSTVQIDRRNRMEGQWNEKRQHYRLTTNMAITILCSGLSWEHQHQGGTCETCRQASCVPVIRWTPAVSDTARTKTRRIKTCQRHSTQQPPTATAINSKLPSTAATGSSVTKRKLSPFTVSYCWFLLHARTVLFLGLSDFWILFFCLCMKYLGNCWMDLCQIHRKDMFGPSHWPVWMSRSPGTKMEKALRHPHCNACKACAIYRMLQVTSSSSRLTHSVAAGEWRGDGIARWRRLACHLCLVKHL